MEILIANVRISKKSRQEKYYVPIISVLGRIKKSYSVFKEKERPQSSFTERRTSQRKAKKHTQGNSLTSIS